MAFKQEVGALLLTMRANIAGWTNGLRNAQNQTKQFRRNIQTDFSAIRNIVAGGAAVFEFRNIVKAGIDYDRFRIGLKAALGTQEEAAKSLGFLRQEADRLGLEIPTLAGSFTGLAAAAKGTVLEGKATRDIFVAVAEAARAMGLSSEQAEGALLAIQQSISKGKVQAEELRGQLGERIPGAVQIMARALNVTTAELDEMLQKGEVGIDVLPKFAAELRKSVAPGVQDAVKSTAAEFARFQNAIFELRKEFSDEFLPALTSGVRYLAGTVIPALELFLDRMNVIKRDTAKLSEGEQRLRLDELNKGIAFTVREAIRPGGAQPDPKAFAALVKERDELAKIIKLYDERNTRIVRGIPEPKEPKTTTSGGGGGGGGKTAEEAERERLRRRKEDFNLFQKMVKDEERALKAKDKAFRESLQHTWDLMEEDERKMAELAEERQRLIEEVQTPLERYAQSVRESVDAYTRGAIQSQEQLQRHVQAARSTYQDELRGMKDESLETLQDIRDAAEGIGAELTQAIVGFVTGTKQNVGDILKAIEIEITQFAARRAIVDPLKDLLEGGFKKIAGGAGGGSAGGIMDFFKSIFGGFRASGGPVGAGQAYVVGERGPEMFVPRQSGTIVPNGGGRPVIVNLQYANPPRNAYELQSAQQQAAMVGQSVRKALTRNT
ncbi:MAG: tape measure protein [Nitrospiraceae bacterium]